MLPDGMVPGAWDIYLSLSSTFESLADNPAYSVRLVNGCFPNEKIWDEERGFNRIGKIDVPKTVDNAGSAFMQIIR